MKILPKNALERLVQALRDQGFRTAGPAERDGVVGYRWIDGAADLPWGLADRHRPGAYGLERGDPDRAFGCTVPTPSVKPMFLPPSEVVFRARRTAGALEFVPAQAPAAPVALVGIRPCDLAALHVLDRVFGGRGERAGEPEAAWARRREGTFVVVAQCSRPLVTCFCADMGTGPFAATGFDIALVELDEGFAATPGTPAGRALMDSLGGTEPSTMQREQVSALRRAADTAARAPLTGAARDVLAGRLEHPAWEAVAERCLACGNCTSVCPTCFCTSLAESPEPEPGEAVRRRRWASCFETGFSYQVGGSVRRSVRSRYRQWLRHKLCTWHDQFGTRGCVGCGRCIAWCPVGIDLRAELAALSRPDRREVEDHG